MLDMYKGTKLSAPELITGCRAEQQDRAKRASALSKHLARGKRPKSNASRDLLRRLKRQSESNDMPDPYLAETWLWDRRKGKRYKGNVAFNPPHEVLGACAKDPEEWCSFTPEQSRFEADLNGALSRVGAPLDIPTAALAFWGDLAQYHTRDAILLILFNFLSGVFRRRFWIVALGKRDICRCGCKGQCTYAELFSVIGWSLRALLVGKYPYYRHDNGLLSESKKSGDKARAALAGKDLPMRGVCIRNTGDWGWMKSACKLTGWKDGKTHRACYKCGADGFKRRWTDASLAAEWRPT